MKSLFILLFLFAQANAQTPDAWEKALSTLRGKLSTELKPAQWKPLESTKIAFDETAPKYKMLNVVWESRNYSDYTNDQGIARARAFQKKHFESLKVAQKITGVPISIVVAIASIETNFGELPHDHVVLNALLSLAALSHEEFGAEVEKSTTVTAATYKAWSKEIESKWHDRRVRFGQEWYEELKKFLILCHAQKWKADELQGSWAGAMGYGQFLPSTLYNLLRLKNGKFHKIELESWRDNLVLIARHLKKKGWPRKGTEEQKRNAILGYNASSDYADAAMAISKALVQKRKKT